MRDVGVGASKMIRVEMWGRCLLQNASSGLRYCQYNEPLKSKEATVRPWSLVFDSAVSILLCTVYRVRVTYLSDKSTSIRHRDPS